MSISCDVLRVTGGGRDLMQGPGRHPTTLRRMIALLIKSTQTLSKDTWNHQLVFLEHIRSSECFSAPANRSMLLLYLNATEENWSVIQKSKELLELIRSWRSERSWLLPTYILKPSSPTSVLLLLSLRVSLDTKFYYG